MELSITYSLEFERHRVKETVQNIDWYRTHQYKPYFPGGLHVDNITGYPMEEIMKMLEQEFNEKIYIEAKRDLEEKAAKYLAPFAEKLIPLGLPLHERYRVTLTRFGVGGSYFLPDTVILNFTGKFGIGTINTVMHEIVHLSTEALILENAVGHWEKERIVDLIMSKVGPFSKPIMQYIPTEYVEKVDPVFEKLFPDIRAIIEEVGG